MIVLKPFNNNASTKIVRAYILADGVKCYI